MSAQELELSTDSTEIDQTLAPYMNNLTLNESNNAPSTGGWGWDQDETDDKSEENKIHNEISNESWGWGEENQKAEKDNECTFPVRNGQPDCAFYLKTGSCKFGLNCRYNHPANVINNQVNYKSEQESFQLGNSNTNEASPAVYYGQMNPEKSYKENKWGDHSERNVEIDCKYYSTPGGCKYGSACRYFHKDKNDASTTLNFLGLPVRPGEKECAYYMTTGNCKYSTNCRFHHPDPTAVNGQAPSGVQNGRNPRPYSFPANQNGGSLPHQPYSYLANQNGGPHQPYSLPTLQKSGPQQSYASPVHQSGGIQQPYALVAHHNGGAQQPYAPPAQMPMAPWPPQRNLNEAVTYVNAAPFATSGTGCYIPPQQCIQPNAEWNGYQAPANQMHPAERNNRPQPPTASSMNGFSRIAPIMGADADGEFPERPGQPECQFFMKTGDCKFKSACKYHHPKSRQLKKTEVVLNPVGLPLRPDQPVCAYYKRNGICKFGRNCRYHHPAELHSSAALDEENASSAYTQEVNNLYDSEQVQESGW